ncbi:hypothetical protein AAF712_003351 [Marasmius tenuissimus]|uniref:Mitochondrial splicing suppressor 51-like C-terminal domain-containing protein n=1 Tax=Marasmius tenuissimus TaxID=585030 RepID=A0ABR3A9L6_9AGAR
MSLLTSFMKRPFKPDEQSMVGWQPRCIACSRTDRLIRIEGSTGRRNLKPCEVCKMTFYCSQEHRDLSHDKHTNEPIKDVPGGLSQCQVNLQFRADIDFSNIMYDAHNGGAENDPYKFQWAPERHLSTWRSLRTGPNCWEEEFEASLQKELGAYCEFPLTLASFMRGASEGLSIPMTILYALQKLSSSNDWTRKRSLTLHLLGAAGKESETEYLRVLDEILHRLPQLKYLHLVMINPGLSHIPVPAQAPPCPVCVKDQKQRTHEIHGMSYHEYVKKRGANYTKPDLAVVFNSPPDDWTKNTKVLVAQKVAAVFTAYTREEAQMEAKSLRAAGANLVPGLGPMKNPWGSLKLRLEPNSVTGFYATNGWLAGGFR